MSVAPRNWTVVSLDPGVEPTACVLWNRGDSVRFYDGVDLATRVQHRHDVMVGKRPTYNGMSLQFDPRKWGAVLEWCHPDLVVIEAIWVRPMQGRASQAKLVYVMGASVGAAAALGRNLLFVRPETWTKAYGLHKSGTAAERKKIHTDAARALNPDLMRPYLTLKKHHNRADAYLMAHLGVQMLDQAYERAVRKGASVDFTPEVWTMR